MDIPDSLRGFSNVIRRRVLQVSDLYRIHAAFEADDRGFVRRVACTEIIEERRRIQGSRRHDDAEGWSFPPYSKKGMNTGKANRGVRDSLLEQAKHEIGVHTPLMCFVDLSGSKSGSEHDKP